MREHTLVLTGELDRVSAPALETEIERLCEAGVLTLTLDLRGLERVDASGVAVIAHRCGWCERHGCAVTLLTDAPSLQRALAQAGAGSRVPLASFGEAERSKRPERAIQPFPLGAN